MKNWRTTLLGVLISAYPIIDAIMQAYNSGYFTEKSGSQLWLGIGVIIFGVLAKDHNVSGTAKQVVSSEGEDGIVGLPKPPKK